MITVSDYSLKEGENGVWYVIVHEPFGKCNLCGKGILKYRDSCPRVCREIDEKVKVLMIPRVKCTVCGKMQRVLPDILLAYKQYSADSINKVENEETSIENILDHPCELTVMRWKKNRKKE